jgi:hypothetical protein
VRFWALLCLACGCDRVFLHDRREDVAIDAAGDRDMDGIPDDVDNCPALQSLDQHDEDNDGVGDLCDNCPHLVNSDQSNGDADNLGDACEDPNDDPVLECISHFDPFTVAPGLAGATGTWTITGGDALAQTDPAVLNALLFIDANEYGNPLIVTAGHITTLGLATDFNNVSVWGEATSGQSNAGVPNNGFVTEMSRSAVSPVDNAKPGIHTSLQQAAMPSNGKLVPFVPSQGPMVEGHAFEIRLDMRLGTTIVAAVRMNGGAPATTTTAIPSTPQNRIALRTYRLAAAYDYILVVERVNAASCPPRR